MRPRSQVQVHQGTTELVPNQKGIRQGSTLPPGLFNLYSEYIIKMEGVVDMEAGIEKLTWKINTKTHADDATVPDESNDDISELIKWDKNNSEILSL